MARTPTSAPPVWPAQRSATSLTRRGEIVRRMALVVAIAAFVLISVSSFTFWRLGATVTNYRGSHFNQGKNGVWLEHTWVGDIHSSADFDALAAQLEREQIHYVFAHVGPMRSDGSIPDSLAPEATTLATELHARLPQIKVLAWIGQLEAASGGSDDSTVNLGKSQVRSGIVQTALHFVQDEGFDGIHYDIEPITNNNSRFLDLLDETRKALPQEAIISISAQKWAPNAHIADWAYGLGKADAWWTTYYFSKVAQYVDQLVVLAYNTAMPTASLYSLAVKQETANVLDAVRAVKNPPEVLIGVPTYGGNSFWFHASAENMSSAIQGVIGGLNSNRTTSPFAGIAVYRLATTDASDWETYDRLWLGH